MSLENTYFSPSNSVLDANERLRAIRQKLGTAQELQYNAFTPANTSANLLGIIGSKNKNPNLSTESSKDVQYSAGGLLAGLSTIPAGLIAGMYANTLLNDSKHEKSFQRLAGQRGFNKLFPSLDPGFYSRNGQLEDVTDYQNITAHGGLPEANDTFSKEIRYNTPTFYTQYGNHDYEALPILKEKLGSTFEAYKTLDAMKDAIPLSSVDWEKTASNLQKPAYPLSFVTKAPEFGSDLGGFRRFAGEKPAGQDVNRFYTVVPDANSQRFGHRLTPRLIDAAYEHIEPDVVPGEDVDGNMFSRVFKKPYESYSTGSVEPVYTPPHKLNELSKEQRFALLEKISPKQLSGGASSSIVWGNPAAPSWGYAEGNVGQGGSTSKGNPSVLVSDVYTPSSLETRYRYTGNPGDTRLSMSRNPYSTYTKSGETKVGPHWGQSDRISNSPGNVANVWVADKVGDVHWRTDLTQARGSFSFADAQAVQSHLGIPVTLFDEGSPETGRLGEPHIGAALLRAVESIRSRENLESTNEVVEKYARRVPRTGFTTNERTPATGWQSAFVPDTTPGIPSFFKKRYDLPAAMQAAGYEPTHGSFNLLNQEMKFKGLQDLNRVRNLTTALPAAGALISAVDPQVAATFGEAVSTHNPNLRSKLLQDTVRLAGTNMAVGAGFGSLASLGIAGTSALSPAVGGALATGLTVAGPSLAVLGTGAAADAYLRSATGQGLARHYRDYREQGPGRGGNVDKVTSELFPTATPVPAHTQTGTAQLRQWNPNQNQVLQELNNRVNLFKENFDPLHGDFGVSELAFGRGGAGRNYRENPPTNYSNGWVTVPGKGRRFRYNNQYYLQPPAEVAQTLTARPQVGGGNAGGSGSDNRYPNGWVTLPGVGRRYRENGQFYMEPPTAQSRVGNAAQDFLRTNALTNWIFRKD
jgi:hypothetical protein